MHPLYKTFAICCISLLAIVYPYFSVNGCYEGNEYDEFRIAWFNPALEVATDLEPFFYNRYFSSYDLTDLEELDYRQNCQEWIQYLGADVKLEDVMTILYRTPKDRLLDTYVDGKLSTYYAENSFIRAVLRPERSEVLDYLLLAFKAEFAHFSAKYDPWEIDEDIDYRKITLQKVIDTAEKKINSLQDSFLLQRYAYQLVVQNRYLDNYEDCQKYYRQFFASEKKSILAPWSMIHYAYSLELEGDTAQSSYYLSRVFDQCSSKKIRCTRIFDRKHLNATLGFAKNNHEKAVIWALQILNNNGPALEEINTILQLDPQCNVLPMLIGREVNKIEDWILTPQVTFFSYNTPMSQTLSEVNSLLTADFAFFKKNQTKDRQYLRSFRTMLEQYIKGNSDAQQDFLHLAIAHLYLVEGEQAAMVEKNLAAVVNRSNPKIQLQVQVERLLNLPNLMDLQSEAAKTSMVNLFSQIAALSGNIPEQLRLYPKLLLYFSRLFQRKGDTITAGLLYNRSIVVPSNVYQGSQYYRPLGYFDRYASLTEIDQLMALINKKDKNRFEVFLTEPLNKLEKTAFRMSFKYPFNKLPPAPSADLPSNMPLPSINQLWDLKGMIAFRQNNLQAAMDAYAHLPEDYWNTNYAFKYYLRQDPFSESNLLATEGEIGEGVNKTKVLEGMLALQKEAENPGSQQAPALYLLGNVYFNTSYWGANWMMTYYGKSSSDLVDPSYQQHTLANNAENQEAYYEMSRAIACYKKALAAKPDDDLATRITYMLARCDEMRQRAKNERNRVRESAPYFSPYFQLLKDKYSKTLAFEEIIATCPLLEEHLEQGDKR
jgi:hypothetical protein